MICTRAYISTSTITTAPSKSISGEVATAERIQRMFSRSRRRADSRNFPISKSSIPKAFTTRFPLTVSCRIWLSSPMPAWIFSVGAPDALAQRPHRPDDQRQQHDRAQRHLPIGDEQHDQQEKKRENVPETDGQILRKRVPHPLHVVDHRGHQSPGRMVLEKTDRLADDFCIDLIAEIGDAGNPRVLHQHVAEIFRNALSR